MRAWFAFAIALALAGCFGDGSTPTAPEAGSLQPNAVQGTATGGISGIVTDDELVPLAGVTIQVLSTNGIGNTSQVVTGPDGAFSILGLEPGDYFLQANRVGYQQLAPMRVTVGTEVVTVALSLPRVVSLNEHVVSIPFRWYVRVQACAMAAGEPYCGYTIISNSNATREYKNNETSLGKLQTLVMEMKWTPSVGTCAAGVRTDIYSPGQETLPNPVLSSGTQADSNPFHWDNVPERARSPTYVIIQREGDQPNDILSPKRTEMNQGKPLTVDGRWGIVSFPYPIGSFGTPVDVSCMYEQYFDAWLTVFYNAPSPTPDWSAFPK